MTLSDVIDQVQFSSDRERDIARKAFWLGANEVLSRTYGDEGGEAWRSMAIGREYGKRLMLKGLNFNVDGLEKLLTGYPSHGFVIDSREAASLFFRVRRFTEDEDALADALGDLAAIPQHLRELKYLSEEVREKTNDDKTEQSIGPESPIQQLAGSFAKAGRTDAQAVDGAAAFAT